ncbi:tail fiber protein [Pseudogulbenkiania ferrooxidans]|uniref:Phage tail collar domain-containing protein n=1 Tax=Pseudogulbenkiania ferrooxidans EGD-HP2 TaxID=1388764 RepID=A0ABP2XLZ6_9NEIS|nr:tail fiber protein [Pseudogulbenkiania ferrooxidans]ERE04354.1 hypothetical protein O166_11815 [Pseudogulbenkiania ferrooxidans EGD-HP2]
MRDVMPPINTADKLFQDGNPSTGALGTIVTANWLNAVQGSIQSVQAELASVLASLGISPDAGKNTQVLDAVRRIAWGGSTRPTTLAGYGITDGATSSQLAAALQYALGINVDLPADLNSISMSGTVPYDRKTTKNSPSDYGVVLTIANQINIPPTGTSQSSWVTQCAYGTDGSRMTRMRVNDGNWTLWVSMADAGRSGVAAGTYGIVTVDDRGRVTAARQMSGNDVPAHDWSKVASGRPTTLSGYGITDAATTAQLTAAVSASTSTAISTAAPSGLVAYFAMATPPNGWLFCNGAAVSRSVYSALFAVIGTLYGPGDGSNTFNLPDLRGQFLRGWDQGKGIDPSRTFGVEQMDAFQGHRHNVQQIWTTGGGGITFPSTGVNSAVQAAIDATDGTVSGLSGGPRVASETRPRNFALLACIKF